MMEPVSDYQDLLNENEEVCTKIREIQREMQVVRKENKLMKEYVEFLSECIGELAENGVMTLTIDVRPALADMCYEGATTGMAKLIQEALRVDAMMEAQVKQFKAKHPEKEEKRDG